jgi:hypothetical protein
MRLALILALGACSGKDGSGEAAGDADTDTDTDADTDTDVPGGGDGDCTPDDAAGTTWDEASGHYIPIEKLVYYEQGEFQGRATRSYIPENPRGLAVSFAGTKVFSMGQGTKESADLEWDPLFNELLQAGFGIAVTEANPEATDGDDWDTSSGNRANNDDLDHYLAYLEELVATTPLEADTPLLLTSFSGGGNFLNLFAQAAQDEGWTIGGATIHNGATFSWDPDDNRFPTIWVTSENEWVENDVVAEDGPGIAFAAYQDHIDAGNPGLYLPTEEIPFLPMRMLRNRDYKDVEAQQAFDEAVRIGTIDASGNRLFDIVDQQQAQNQFLRDTVAEGADRITPQFEVVWAIHRYNGIHAIEECEFLMPGF